MAWGRPAPHSPVCLALRRHLQPQAPPASLLAPLHTIPAPAPQAHATSGRAGTVGSGHILHPRRTWCLSIPGRRRRNRLRKLDLPGRHRCRCSRARTEPAAAAHPRCTLRAPRGLVPVRPRQAAGSAGKASHPNKTLRSPRAMAALTAQTADGQGTRPSLWHTVPARPQGWSARGSRCSPDTRSSPLTPRKAAKLLWEGRREGGDTPVPPPPRGGWGLRTQHLEPRGTECTHTGGVITGLAARTLR